MDKSKLAPKISNDLYNDLSQLQQLYQEMRSSMEHQPDRVYGALRLLKYQLTMAQSRVELLGDAWERDRYPASE